MPCTRLPDNHPLPDDHPLRRGPIVIFVRRPPPEKTSTDDEDERPRPVVDEGEAGDRDDEKNA